jgi:rfaE bifunctional protein kinase chain/domain
MDQNDFITVSQQFMSNKNDDGRPSDQPVNDESKEGPQIRPNDRIFDDILRPASAVDIAATRGQTDKTSSIIARFTKDSRAPFQREIDSRSREFTLMSPAAAAQKSFFPIGLKQEMLPLKSEYKGEPPEDKTFERFKPRLLELLEQTAKTGEQSSDLSRTEAKELAESRNRLNDCDNSSEALSNALHLARLYQHLRYINEALKATLFALGIDPENILGRQLLKELERVQIAELGLSGHELKDPSTQNALFTRSSLRHRIINLSGGKVIVVGDLLIDELVEGRPERISREAPVLVLEHVDTELIPGGAANTAHNITALGGQCHAIGVCGKDDYAPKLGAVLARHGITYDLVEDDSRPTTVKSRVISKSHSLLQQLLRIDRISHAKISPAIEAKVIDKIGKANENFHAIVVSDYKAGVITDGVIEAVRSLAETRDTIVIVDAQNRFERFNHCTLMTPNQPDAEAEAGIKITSKESLQALGEVLLNKSGVKALLVTRGGEGMVLFERGKAMVEIPAFNRSEVFDVTGAGDTVVATMALALTSGATLPEAMALGNLAASIVVRKPGTEVTSQKEMLDHLEQLDIPA